MSEEDDQGVKRSREEEEAEEAQHDIVQKDMGKPGPKRPCRRARKTAVQVAAVRQIPRAAEKAKGVDNRNHNQCAPQRCQLRCAQQAAHDFNTDHFIPMNRSADKQRGAGPFAVVHLKRQTDGRVIGQDRDRQSDGFVGAAFNPVTCDLKGLWGGHDQLRPDPSKRAASAAARRMALDLCTVSIYSASASLS